MKLNVVTKYRLKDADNQSYEVGYKLYPNDDTKQDEPLLWLESQFPPGETVTLHLKTAQVRDLITKLEKLCAVMEVIQTSG
jgi:hypothetical protein